MSFAKTITLATGEELKIAEASRGDARAVLGYLERISGESEFLSFGPGEFGLSVAQEMDFLSEAQAADNQIFMLGRIDGVIVSVLHFAGGRRPRVQHCGEFGMSVSKPNWSKGVGSAMLDALIEWAQATNVVRRIALRVRTDNDRALRLYQRKGFVLEGTTCGDVCVNGQYFDHYCMARSISAAGR